MPLGTISGVRPSITRRLALLAIPAVAEMLAMLIFVFVGVSAAMHMHTSIDPRIPLAFGLCIFVLASALGSISGAHINPAVTLGLLVGLRISVLKAVVYWLAQTVGAVIAAFALGAAYGPRHFSYFGVTDFAIVPETVTLGQAFFIEFVLTFVLVFVVRCQCAKDTKEEKAMAPLAIGLTVAACHCAAVPFTGCGINPLRSLASCLAAQMFGAPMWTNHWLYWVAPMLGAFTAAVVWMFTMGTVVDEAEPKETSIDV